MPYNLFGAIESGSKWPCFASNDALLGTPYLHIDIAGYSKPGFYCWVELPTGTAP
jgi:hypothetical protein